MKEKKPETGFTRRGFLKSGSAVLAGGIMGCASVNVSSSKKKTADAAPALPWPWGKIDPMEAGSRAYRFYLDVGG